MTIELEDGMMDYLEDSTGGIHLILRDADDADKAARGMNSAVAALYAIPHPEEPDDPLPSSASDLPSTGEGPRLWADIVDAEVYDGLLEHVLAAVVGALEAEGVSGRLGWVKR